MRLRPRHVGDVNQPVDALFHLDEGAEVGQVADLALEPRADRVLLGELLPRVRLDLLQAEADAVRLLVEVEHLALDLLPDRQQLGRVLHLLRPGHLGDVDQPLDALLELDEGAVVGEAHDLALDARAHRVLDGRGRPRVGLQLLASRARRARCSRSNLSTTTLTSSPTAITSLGWLMRPHDMSVMCSRPSMPPRSTKAPYSVMFLTLPVRILPSSSVSSVFVLLLGVLLFEDRLAREHDVAALLVDLDHAHPELLPLERVEVAHRPHVHLAAGQEGAHARCRRRGRP